MPLYTSHSGKIKDTSTMNIVYIERALAVARAENDEANIAALEQELNLRNGN